MSRLFAVLILLLPSTALAADWPEAMYNPKPAPDDLILPLPCGGAMAFRPVDVPAARAPLDDVALTLGHPDTESGYNDYQRAAFLGAPFPAPDGGRRYWIGKYPVTHDQYAAREGAACNPPSAAGRIAQNQVAWSDTVDYAANWSSWLLAHARDKLPRRGDTYAYARLPTEDEWEYAARGGDKIGEADFLAPLWPMPAGQGIERYAWAGRAAGSRPQQVGQLLPNPLGLYDVLGNVAQIALEPYRLNRVGRPQGQAGGFTVRGGNYTSPLSSFTTAMREEIPPFDPATNAPTRLKTVGFRLVLSAPTAGGQEEVSQISEDFDRLRAAGQTDADDPRRLVAKLKQSTGDEATRQGLDRLAATLDSTERERADEARVALGAELEAGTLLAQNVWNLERFALLQERLVSVFPDPAQQGQVRTAAARNRNNEAGSLDGYMRLVRQIGTGPARDALSAQADIVRQEMQERGQTYLTPFLALVVRHAVAVAQSRPAQREQVSTEILAVPQEQARR